MERAKILEELIDNNWSSKRQFAEHIGIPPTTLQSILKRGVGKASIDNVIRVCRGLGITVDQLEQMTKENTYSTSGIVKESTASYSTSSKDSYVYFPTSVSAGLPICVESISKEECERITLPHAVMGKWAGRDDIFFTRVNGDSMNRIIPHCSLIAVKSVELSELKDNDIVVFSNGGDYSVKRFFHDKENERVIFRPDSHDNRFFDYIVSHEDAKSLKIHGKVVLYIVELD